MSRDWAKEPGFSDAQIQRLIDAIKRVTFFGELTLKSVGGKITDAIVKKTKKPDSPDE